MEGLGLNQLDHPCAGATARQFALSFSRIPIRFDGIVGARVRKKKKSTGGVVEATPLRRSVGWMGCNR